MKKVSNINISALVLFLFVLVLSTNLTNTSKGFKKSFTLNKSSSNHSASFSNAKSASESVLNSSIASTKKSSLLKTKKHSKKRSNHSLIKKRKANRSHSKENPYKNLEILKDPNVNPKNLPFNKRGEHTNFLGLKVQVNTQLKEPPFQITRCDQSVHFHTQYVPNLEDYLTRKEGYVIVNAHYLHLFTQDKKELIGSILLTQSSVAPSEPRGAKDCVQVDGGDLSPSILLCFTNIKLKKNILDVLDQLSDCRVQAAIGGIEKKKENLVIKKIENCGLYKKGENPQDVIDRFNEAKKAKEIDKMKWDIQGDTWSPAPVQVPGSME